MEIIRNFELFLLIASYIRVWIAITIIGLTFRLPPSLTFAATGNLSLVIVDNL